MDDEQRNLLRLTLEASANAIASYALSVALMHLLMNRFSASREDLIAVVDHARRNAERGPAGVHTEEAVLLLEELAEELGAGQRST